ncbi:MAG: AAA family ATPase [Pyrinomonadaceae bacterium]
MSLNAYTIWERSPEVFLTRAHTTSSDAGSVNMQLILDKITTPAQLPRLSRARLLKTLQASLASCTSTIINGRAGTGKTLLATDFAFRSGRRVAWYKVDASDTDLSVFLQYLVESVRSIRPDFGKETLAQLLETASLEDIPLLAEAFVYELLEAGGNPLLIVLEDLHLIYDAEWVVPFFRRLLPLLPADAHMLITGRSLPPAPLWRMRSKQTLCVIEEQEIAFNSEETRKLFESYGLSDSQAAMAFKQTRGRAAMLDTMAALLGSATRAAEQAAPVTKRRSRFISHVHGYCL